MKSIEDVGKECTPHHTTDDLRSNSPLEKENEHQPATPERRRPTMQHALSPSSLNGLTGNRTVNAHSVDSNSHDTNTNSTFNDTNALKRKRKDDKVKETQGTLDSLWNIPKRKKVTKGTIPFHWNTSEDNIQANQANQVTLRATNKRNGNQSTHGSKSRAKGNRIFQAFGKTQNRTSKNSGDINVQSVLLALHAMGYRKFSENEVRTCIQRNKFTNINSLVEHMIVSVPPSNEALEVTTSEANRVSLESGVSLKSITSDEVFVLDDSASEGEEDDVNTKVSASARVSDVNEASVDLHGSSVAEESKAATSDTVASKAASKAPSKAHRVSHDSHVGDDDVIVLDDSASEASDGEEDDVNTKISASARVSDIKEAQLESSEAVEHNDNEVEEEEIDLSDIVNEEKEKDIYFKENGFETEEAIEEAIAKPAHNDETKKAIIRDEKARIERGDYSTRPLRDYVEYRTGGLDGILQRNPMVPRQIDGNVSLSHHQFINEEGLKFAIDLCQRCSHKSEEEVRCVFKGRVPNFAEAATLLQQHHDEYSKGTEAVFTTFLKKPDPLRKMWNINFMNYAPSTEKNPQETKIRNTSITGESSLLGKTSGPVGKGRTRRIDVQNLCCRKTLTNDVAMVKSTGEYTVQEIDDLSDCTGKIECVPGPHNVKYYRKNGGDRSPPPPDDYKPHLSDEERRNDWNRYWKEHQEVLLPAIVGGLVLVGKTVFLRVLGKAAEHLFKSWRLEHERLVTNFLPHPENGLRNRSSALDYFNEVLSLVHFLEARKRGLRNVNMDRCYEIVAKAVAVFPHNSFKRDMTEVEVAQGDTGVSAAVFPHNSIKRYMTQTEVAQGDTGVSAAEEESRNSAVRVPTAEDDESCNSDVRVESCNSDVRVPTPEDESCNQDYSSLPFVAVVEKSFYSRQCEYIEMKDAQGIEYAPNAKWVLKSNSLAMASFLSCSRQNVLAHLCRKKFWKNGRDNVLRGMVKKKLPDGSIEYYYIRFDKTYGDFPKESGLYTYEDIVLLKVEVVENEKGNAELNILDKPIKGRFSRTDMLKIFEEQKTRGVSEGNFSQFINSTRARRLPFPASDPQWVIASTESGARIIVNFYNSIGAKWNQKDSIWRMKFDEDEKYAFNALEIIRDEKNKWREVFRGRYEGKWSLMASDIGKMLQKECYQMTYKLKWSPRKSKMNITRERFFKDINTKFNNKSTNKSRGIVGESGREYFEFYCIETKKRYRIERYLKMENENWDSSVKDDQVHGKDKPLAEIIDDPKGKKN